MTLSAPTKPVWTISIVIGLLGILGTFVSIPLVAGNQFWLVAVAFALLAIATTAKGL